MCHRNFYISISLFFLIAFNVSFLSSTMIEKEIVNAYTPDKKIGEIVVNELEKAGLIQELYIAILNDFDVCVEKMQMIVDQLKKNGVANKVKESFVSKNYNEAEFDFKAAKITFNRSLEWNMFSEETKINILTAFLFGFSAMINQKEKMDHILNNEQVVGILFLMTAMGIDFSCIDIVNKISEKVFDRCKSLKNENLNNCEYESTIYFIYHEISKKLCALNLFSTIFFKICDLKLSQLKQTVIELKSNESTKNKKKK
jgi:hypothetical protein